LIKELIENTGILSKEIER